ncbi:MAG: hypothetical protein ABH830_03270 [Patescibacteria group bacterium]
MEDAKANTANTLSPEEQWAMGSALRQEKRGNQISEEAGINPEEEELSLRQQAAAARIEKEKKEKTGATEMITAPVRMGTSYALKQAWLYLAPTLGLTLIYINTHVFLRWIFPNLFCKLGEEWMPKIVAPHSAKNIAGTAFGIAEIIALVFLDALALFLIMGIISVINILVDIYLNPIGGIWNYGIEAIYNFFKALF